MKTYLDYKTQVGGVNEVLETIKTVEKISASSIHFLKQKFQGLDSHIKEIERILSRLFFLFPHDFDHFLASKKYGEKKALINGTKKGVFVVTSNKGLVGGMWHGIVSSFLAKKQEYNSVIVFGTKGNNYLKEEGIQIEKYFNSDFNEFTQEKLKEVKDYFFSEFSKGRYSQVDILYPKFITLGKQEPAFVKFLPFTFKVGDIVAIKNPNKGLPIFEPSRKKFIDSLMKKHIKLFFDKIILEAKLSELSARTVSMEHAITKTEDLLGDIKLSYLKGRRRLITQKQLELFSANKGR